MKELLIFIGVLLISIKVYPQSNSSVFDWSNPKFKVVKAYLYGLQEDEPGLIVRDGRLNSSVVDTVGVVLNLLQIEKVIDVVTGRTNDELDKQAFCFMPHHGIVFYDDYLNPVASLSICFFCGN